MRSRRVALSALWTRFIFNGLGVGRSKSLFGKFCEGIAHSFNFTLRNGELAIVQNIII